MAFFDGWGLRHWRNGKIFLATVSAIFGTVVAVDTGYPVVEPAVPALRYWVRDHTAKAGVGYRLASEPTRIGLIDVQISLAKGRQSTIKNSLLGLEILLAKITDPEEKVRTQFQIRELQEEFADLDGDIKRYKLDREKQ